MLYLGHMNSPILRNILGLLALIGLHLAADRYTLMQRPMADRFLPYLFLLGMYAWIVVHNRLLFEGYFLRGKKQLYLLIFTAVMVFFSINMHLILTHRFQVEDTWPAIIRFWVYTLAGLGVFALYRTQVQPEEAPVSPKTVPSGFVTFSVDGERMTLSVDQVLYLESLENYVKVVTDSRTYVTRLTLKQGEELLPDFVRISRSHLINPQRLDSTSPDQVTVAGRQLRVGKVYKKYVAEMLGE